MEQKLIEILNNSPSIGALLRNGDLINLPNWYIAGGAIPTLVWNSIASNEPEQFLNDIDIVYYDSNDLTEAAENKAAQQVRDTFPEIKYKIDVKNQARVHTWYRDKSGNRIAQYSSIEAGINMWLSVTAIGVRFVKGQYKVYAPYGLDDLFSMNVKPNRLIISADRYKKKIKRWKEQRPQITFQDYDYK